MAAATPHEVSWPLPSSTSRPVAVKQGPPPATTQIRGGLRGRSLSCHHRGRRGHRSKVSPSLLPVQGRSLSCHHRGRQGHRSKDELGRDGRGKESLREEE